jgi:hypothetical protein
MPLVVVTELMSRHYVTAFSVDRAEREAAHRLVEKDVVVVAVGASRHARAARGRRVVRNIEPVVVR